MEHQVDTEIRFVQILRRNGLSPESYDHALLGRYLSLLKEWNKKVNLISRVESSSSWFTHILHSICPLFLIQIPPGIRVLDIGTGGGLPGIPIGIMRPDLRIVLADSIRKKAAAVADIVSSLGLSNLSVVNSRVEDLVNDPFHVVLSRAVAPLDDLIRWSKPLVFNGEGTNESSQVNLGRRTFRMPFLLAWKGGDLGAEIARARTKHPNHPITILDLVFPGSVEAGLEEKKVVIVEL